MTAEESNYVNWAVELEIKQAQKRFSCHRKHPKAVLLAGQPGSGKTLLSSLMLPQLDNDAVLINGDDYRRYHPNYKNLYEENGPDAVVVHTSLFANKITEKLIERLSDLGINMVIEGTGRTVEVPQRTTRILTSKGYSVEMAVIAVNPILSLISTVQRFYQMYERGIVPRATPLKAHDDVVSVLPMNLDALWELQIFLRITIWTRDKELIYDSTSSSSPPSTSLKGVWNKTWSFSEIKAIKTMIFDLYSLDAKINLGQGEVINTIIKRFIHEVVRNKPEIKKE